MLLEEASAPREQLHLALAPVDGVPLVRGDHVLHGQAAAAQRSHDGIGLDSRTAGRSAPGKRRAARRSSRRRGSGLHSSSSGASFSRSPNSVDEAARMAWSVIGGRSEIGDANASMPTARATAGALSPISVGPAAIACRPQRHPIRTAIGPGLRRDPSRAEAHVLEHVAPLLAVVRHLPGPPEARRAPHVRLDPAKPWPTKNCARIFHRSCELDAGRRGTPR